MLKMRARFAICCAKGIAIGVYGDFFGACVQHRLEGYYHTRNQFFSLARFAKIWDIRVLVYRPPDSMPRELLQCHICPGADKTLNSIADIPTVFPAQALSMPTCNAFCNLQKFLLSEFILPTDTVIAISVKILPSTQINGQYRHPAKFFAWNPVHHFVVETQRDAGKVFCASGR